MIPLRDDNPTTVTPVVTVAIIAACTVAFLWQLTLPPPALQEITYALGVIPIVLLGGESLPPEIARVPPWLTIVTSMFLHGGWLHLIGNMLYMWIFADNIEDALGHVTFVVFYVVCGAAAALTQSALDVNSTVPMIGASGAIAGVLGAYLVLFPRAHVLVLLPLGFFTQLFRLPALLVLGFWFVLQFLQGGLAQPTDGGGVAYWAHIGGFAAGVVLILLIPRRPSSGAWRNPRRGPWG
ncbi:MAG: rhomboid family intramembrane serine protease [Dongiaceae bacterium]